MTLLVTEIAGGARGEAKCAELETVVAGDDGDVELLGRAGKAGVAKFVREVVSKGPVMHELDVMEMLEKV